MATIILGKPGRRIFVNKGNQEYLVPYWISGKGNLCWQIDQTVYVKLKNGFTMMNEKDKWGPADAATKATIQTSQEANRNE